MLATSFFHPDWSLLRDQFWSLTVGGLTAGSIYALVALGYTLVYGVLRLINFAHSEIFMFGTFGAVYATRCLGITRTTRSRPGSRSSPCSSSASRSRCCASGGAAVAPRASRLPARSANEAPPDSPP